MWRNVIQIAGVKSLEEAEMLIANGVEFIGFPLRLTVNAEDTTEEEAREIIKQIKSKSKPVLITYLSNHKEIIDFCEFLNVGIVQLHGEISREELAKLKEVKPELKIIKSLVVKQNNARELLKTLKELEPYADAFITDTFDPETKAEGATGKTHDWNISAELARISAKPVILAGGLTQANVAEAIRKVKPDGVDSHTGVEDKDGNKNPEKVKAFVDAAKKAFAELSLRV